MTIIKTNLALKLQRLLGSVGTAYKAFYIVSKIYVQALSTKIEHNII